MGITYFKRYRMEIDLRGRRFDAVRLPEGYRLVAFSPERIMHHAEAKFFSFCHEIDADVFSCFSDLEGCQKLMEDISQKVGFVPEATWLVEYADTGASSTEWCGTIQGVRAPGRYGGIQNVGITPQHRGRGVGTALIAAALSGFQHVGLLRAYLEVTARNEQAVRLYRRMGFRRTKTLYKAVELAFT
jgi:RimJ/RimL family protein N-acetyltransferase